MDEDLQRIRQARMQELQQKQQQGQGPPSGDPQGGGDSQQRQEAEAEARKSILVQILTPEAHDRLGRIALVKAERARDLENRLIAMARTGQIRQRVEDEELKQMLEAVNEQLAKEEPKIVYQRRPGILDDDDDWD